MPHRRSFIASLGALGAAAIFKNPEVAYAGPRVQQTNGKWDLSWLDAMKGKHRQVFDLGSRNLATTGNPLRVPRNYMNAHFAVSALPDSELNTIVGIAGDAFAMNASDRLWKEYALGEHYQIKDPVTGKWAERNFFIDGAGTVVSPTSTVKALLARGTIFWQCNNALNGAASEFATAMGKDPAAVSADFVAGLNPWVKLVPAHTMLLGLAQEHGFTYEKL